MGAFREWMHRLLGTLRPRRGDEELAEELRLHADLERGHGRRVVGTAQAMDALRDQRGLPWLDDVMRDVRHGVRSLGRSPVFTAVAVITLTFGIGATAAVFQLFDAIRLSTLPVKAPHELAIVELADTTGFAGRRTTGYPVLTNPLWERLRGEPRAFEGILAWANTDFRLDAGGRLQSFSGLYVSGDFFTVLGVPPILGRVFDARDDRPGCGVPGAVIGHGFWQRVLGSDPDVIGRTIRVDNIPVEVIGVTGPRFLGLEVGASYDIAVPICSQAALGSEGSWLADPTVWWLTVMGRLAPGQTLDQASARLDSVSPALFEATVPAGFGSEMASDYLGLRLRAVPGAGGVSNVRDRFGDPLAVLLATTGLVLLLVCTNLANLVLSRASSRQTEFVVRQALGATRGRLLQQAVVENALVAFGGAAAGVAVAGFMARSLLRFLGPEVSIATRPDARLLGFGAAAAVLTCLVFGIAPAWRAARAATGPKPSAAARGTAPSAGGSVLRRGLVVAQVAASLVLVVGALLFIGTLRNLLAVDLGFRPGDVYVAQVDASLMNLQPGNRSVFTRDVLERVRQVPEVAAAAEILFVPLGGEGWGMPAWLDGGARADATDVAMNAISDQYFETMGIPLMAGRDFTPSDSASAPAVAIVSTSLARRLGIDGNPLGARFQTEGAQSGLREYEIVGLVSDTRYLSLRDDIRPTAFVPVAQSALQRTGTNLVIRSDAGLADITSSLTRAVDGAGPLAAVQVTPFDATLRQRLVRESLLAALSTFFGVLATLIAAVGVYGVVAESIARRTSEIGLRMALGATRVDIVRMVLVQAGRLLGAGLAAGVVVAAAAAGSLRSLMFGVQPRDAGSFALACACLALAAAAAMAVPAWRAARLEPVTALREG